MGSMEKRLRTVEPELLFAAVMPITMHVWLLRKLCMTIPQWIKPTKNQAQAHPVYPTPK